MDEIIWEYRDECNRDDNRLVGEGEPCDFHRPKEKDPKEDRERCEERRRQLRGLGIREQRRKNQSDGRSECRELGRERNRHEARNAKEQRNKKA